MLFKRTSLLVALIFPAMITMSADAAENAESRSSTSFSYGSIEQLDKTVKNELLKQTETDIMPALSTEGYREESTVMGLHITGTDHFHSGDYSIYDASTELISDFDYDGFYHRFSVEVDIDTVYDTAYVYAVLYLSYEGGPWNHYATSNDYHIHGDSELDTFIIETELADGFPPGYYDIRIEVYDAYHHDWLLSYGPYDDASLSALPLEDSYYDDEYVHHPVETELVVAAHGHGSMGWLLFTLPGVLIIGRRFRQPAIDKTGMRRP